MSIIEFVSRANKAPGRGRKLHLKKQSEARRGRVNLIEIDLLRGGKPATLAGRLGAVPGKSRTPYHASVWRAAEPLQVEYYGFPLRQRLPAIGLPLRPMDADAALDLQDLVDECYRRGRYDDIDYDEALSPALSDEDAQWATSLLREKKLLA